MTDIPLIDLARWFDGDAAERGELAHEVDEHLQRLGFLLVINHDIPSTLIDACRADAKAFFHLPAEVKGQVAVDDDVYRGWVGPGLEATAATYGVETPPDLRESFTCGPVEVPQADLVEIAPRWFAPNRWPTEPLSFRASLESWWRAGRKLADELLDIFSLALGLPEQQLRNQCTATTADGTLNWYPPRSSGEPTDGQFRIGPHTDFGTLTILDRQPGVGGLQVLDEQGVWMHAPHIDGGLLVNTGDLMRRWTNDRWMSNEHRVLPPPESAPDEELLSLVFFHEPDHDALITALDTCVSDESPVRHPPILAGDYAAMKMDALSVS